MNDLKQEFLEHLEFLGMADEEFFKFIEGKVKRYLIPWDSFGWGVFPILDEEGRIADIRMVVPEIQDEKTMLINIHEYKHAFDLYTRLYTLDNTSNDEEYEKRAREAELKILARRIQQNTSNN